MSKPLTCTRCGTQVAVVDDTRGLIDHGPAVVDQEGTVHPDPNHADAGEYPQNTTVMASATRAVCTAKGCGHSWRLRRRFDPHAA